MACKNISIFYLKQLILIWNVKAKMVANGDFTEFNLLKTRKASVSDITKEIKSFAILVLTPPPLNLLEMNLKTSLVPSQYQV